MLRACPHIIHDIRCVRVSSGHIAANAGSELSTIIAFTIDVSYAPQPTGFSEHASNSEPTRSPRQTRAPAHDRRVRHGHRDVPFAPLKRIPERVHAAYLHLAVHQRPTGLAARHRRRVQHVRDGVRVRVRVGIIGRRCIRGQYLAPRVCPRLSSSRYARYVLDAPDQPMGYPSAATTSPSLTGEVAIGSHARSSDWIALEFDPSSASAPTGCEGEDG